MNHTKKRLFSGIQPSGLLNIGHYMGAIQHWVKLQDQYECLFCIVDLHTITVPQNPLELKQHCYDLLALYLACGIEPQKSILFIQSHVSQHAELAWILTCLTHMGELKRMTQFKEKSLQQKKHIDAGLFCYPILMAADILSHQTHLVPVGKDQKQHLELTRQLANRFNLQYNSLFTIPEPYIAKHGSRIMRLQEPDKKMSKSDPNPANAIHLLDPPELIMKKIKCAVTDSGRDIRHAPDKLGINNLLTLLSQATASSIETLEKQYQQQTYRQFKQDVAESLIHMLSPIQETFHTIRPNQPYLDRLLKIGAEQASASAEKTLKQVHQALGFISHKS